MDKKSKTLLYSLIIISVVSISFLFYKTIILNDYSTFIEEESEEIIEVETEANNENKDIEQNSTEDNNSINIENYTTIEGDI